ncbi:MAG: TIGR02221 family CRISPR-associated protein [Candidatus Accumulibacter sp.]|jgi:CRISPR-associated Csx2 family protein|nr:TIGR02221 family CRISPR-associated protein [Accumulibacter sp.]
MTTLISFLGKGKEKGGAYRTANYRFEDKTRTVPFFGMALAEYLQPERLILIGTSGSMWDVFFVGDSAGDAALLDLIEAVHRSAVTDAMLAEHSRHFSQKLGYPVECLLIDYARDEKGQVDLLARLAKKLHENEHIALDITHSFRHLPMLALVAARFLTRVKKIVVDDIYYGALEMTENDETPVIHLKGMLGMLDWVDALAAYDQTGYYSVFSPLYDRAGKHETAEQLRKASFFERVRQAGQARKILNRIHSGDASPMLDLFQPELNKRIAWAKSPRYSERQEQLAQTCLENGDYENAAIFGFEAAVSRRLQSQNNSDPLNYDQRKEAKDNLDQEARPRNGRTLAQQSYLDLRELRNALAHGTRSDFREIQRALDSEESLRDFLVKRLRDVRDLQ